MLDAKRILIGLGGLALVVLVWSHRWQPTPVPVTSPALDAAIDSMRVSRERFERLLADSIRWQSQQAEQESSEANAKRQADELRRARIALRSRPALPAPSDTSALRAALDTVTAERDLAVGEADSLRAALAHADSGKQSLRSSTREIQLGANKYLGNQLWAEGQLDNLKPKVEALERELTALRRATSGTHFGLTAEASVAGGCWTAMAGAQVEQRGKLLFVEGRATAAGGVGVGGCGRPRLDIRPDVGPAGRVGLYIGV